MVTAARLPYGRIVQSAFLLFGLVMAAWGHAILHEWRGAAALWDWLEGKFPEPVRSPAPLGGGMLLTTGGLLVLVPALG
jgi:hypothetical protein